jgi:hypothetical protein
LLGGIGRIFRGFRDVFKDKKKLVAVIVLAAVWTVLNILQSMGINPFPYGF